MKRTIYAREIFCLLFLLGTVTFSADMAEARLQCYDCHGMRETVDYRPLDAPFRNATTGGFQGNHQTHVPAPGSAELCATCHPGSNSYTSAHRDGTIKLSKNINTSPLGATYGNHTTPISIMRTQLNTRLTTCSSVNCHFEKTTPVWGSTPLGTNECSTCHDTPPTDGSHGKKHGEYYGNSAASCAKCHPDHTQDAGGPHSHALDAGKRPLSIQMGTQGRYSGGSVKYPDYLPSGSPTRSGVCLNLYCHSDGLGLTPKRVPRWTGQSTTTCYSCHGGRVQDNTQSDCIASGGIWDSGNELCGPFINMTSNGHNRLVGPQWIRKYSCYYCHNSVVNSDGTIKDRSKHVNATKDIEMSSQWGIVGMAPPTYVPSTKTCVNVYCHSDGTTNPVNIRNFSWTEGRTNCNSCHGHELGSCSSANCHDGRTDGLGKVWTVKTGWPSGQEWKASIPMFTNAGAGTPRANSHSRHSETSFTCDNCHAGTIINGSCTDCHQTGIPPGQMGEVAHINANFHVNKARDVVFLQGGSYNSVAKTCSNTACHTGGTDPQWGDSVTRAVICLNCHGTTGADVDDFDAFNGSKGRISLTEWQTTGHGRQTAAGVYPASGNPAANFPGNPCWYCHDNNVLHKDNSNPFRLRLHPQFSNRFEKECVYCHMQGVDSECLGCHYAQESIGLQLTYTSVMRKHGNAVVLSGCRNGSCHDTDDRLHKSGAGFWDSTKKADVRNQYIMMGVCLQCHDDDSGGKCLECHTAPPENPLKYELGFDPGTGRIKPTTARATSVHFGRKHYKAYQDNGVWKGGKFCWDCHDPHGDSNIYMVQAKVATIVDSSFGKPLARATVSFTRKQSGLDYAKMNAPYDGICNVCHSAGSQHFRSDGGDGHNAGRVCTICHEHRFSDSHADKQACSTCHSNKPVPRHSGFGLPRDCTKCHAGIIGMRMDVMGQLRANSHHIQGVEVTNKHCYECHWESTPDGLIDNKYHEGYNYKTYSTVKNAKVDLVVYGKGVRPTYYNTTTAIQFLASNVSNANKAISRAETAKVNNHCLSCHSDQNNDSDPFKDCKTPRQYAWDNQSIAARYSQTGTTQWGKYNSTTYANTNKKDTVTKALSGHGNATASQGGWSASGGYDTTITNTRAGTYNVTCFDCHSSHGSKVTGISSSYITFNGTRNGANLKETQAGKGGYTMNYKASSNPDTNSINPYNTGAGQCFDCHLTQNEGATPWGYQSTYGATASIMGYKDTIRFGQGAKGSTVRFAERAPKATIVGGHFKASGFLNRTTAVQDRIGGLCTPCHDPHGVSPTLGGKQAYAVPMLKGTWMTSPYKEDKPAPDPTGNNISTDGGGIPRSWGKYRNLHPSPTQPYVNYSLDKTVFNGTSRISETDDQFAGLCLRCHKKDNLTDGINKNQTWKSMDRIHETVKGWGANTEHSYTCSKCHQPHNSGLPKLMQTNCLDYKHRGFRVSGGSAWSADRQSSLAHGNGGEHRGYPSVNNSVEGMTACHINAPLNSGTWPDRNLWNNVTPW